MSGGDAAGKVERGRAPVGRVLIVARDAGIAGNVLPVFKIGHDVRSQPAEMIARVQKEMLAEAVRPVDVGVDPESIGRIGETEQIGVAGPGALEVEAPIEFVFAADCLVQARLQRILMAAVENRHLVVIERIAGNVGQRIELQQGLRLRADRDHIAGKGQPGCGIEDEDRLAEGVEQAGEVARPFRRGGDEAGLGLGDLVARPLVGHEESRPVRQQMRNLERSAEGKDAGDAIVGRPWACSSPLSE